jgi:hypothetical protein
MSRFSRKTGSRLYKKRFVLATEGVVTEPSYFTLLKQYSAFIIEFASTTSDKSAPRHVLDKMKKYLKQKPLLRDDEAWLVTDKDEWTEAQLNDLHLWQRSDNRYGFALSNPCFEYWLLLHFEEGARVKSVKDCCERLCKKLPNYKKSVKNIKRGDIEAAIMRAKKRDKPYCEDWPRNIGQTTVYRLVEKMLKST